MLEQMPQLAGLQDVVGFPVFTMPPVLSPEAPGKRLRCAQMLQIPNAKIPPRYYAGFRV